MFSGFIAWCNMYFACTCMCLKLELMIELLGINNCDISKLLMPSSLHISEKKDWLKYHTANFIS